MKKLFLLIVGLLLMTLTVRSQVTTLRFTGRDANNQYVQLNRVVITDQTQNWQEIIYYPDTVLHMGSTDIEDFADISEFKVLQNVPNPFDGGTRFTILQAENGQTSIEVTDMNGQKVLSHSAYLNKGAHVFQVELQTVQTYILTAKCGNSLSSIKLVNYGTSAQNQINYIGEDRTSLVNRELKSGEKGWAHRPFHFGDQMAFIGFVEIEGTEYRSEIIQQQQYSSELITLSFQNLSRPIVRTLPVSQITRNSAVSGGEVISSGGDYSELTCGVCWSTNPHPIVSENTVNKTVFLTSHGWKLAEGSITPALQMSNGAIISDLMDYLYSCEQDDILYFESGGRERIETNIKCAEGEGLQDDVVSARWYFDNQEDPQILYMQLPFLYDATGNALDEELENCKIIELTGKQLKISWTFDVGNDIHTFVMVYRDSKDVAKSDHGYTTDGNSIGIFTSTITDLDPNTTYYVRAYAKNSIGISYGEEFVFTTTDVAVADGDFVITFGDMQQWNVGWSECGVTTSGDGTQMLFVNVAPEKPTSQFPMLYFTVTAETGQHNNSNDSHLFMMYYYAKAFNLNMSGQLIKNMADYWAGNGPKSMGVANIEITYFDPVSLTISLKGEGTFWNAIDNLQTETISEVPYVIEAQNFKLEKRDDYGQLEVKTTEVSNITSTTAVGGGSVTSTENATITARGVCWSTSHNPTIEDNHTTDGNALGNFTSSITGLIYNTTYYVRAYATNSNGTTYGEEVSFTTLSKPQPQPCPGTPTVTDIDGNTYNTVQIGEQCWMKENLKTTKFADGTSIRGPGASTTMASWYYPNNYYTTKPEFGLLYNWKAVMNYSSSSNSNPSGVQGICPTGWHVPSDAEWTQLTDYVSSSSDFLCNSNSTNIAKAMASTSYWESSTNTCAIGNDLSSNNATGFSAVPAGHSEGNNSFYYYAKFWSATEHGSDYAYARFLGYQSAIMSRSDPSYNKKYDHCSVRCLRDETNTGKQDGGQPCPDMPTLTDVDGNTYNTVQIGNQCWMKENLRTTKYADGTDINIGNNTSLTTPYRYIPNNDTSTVPTYGYLYNCIATTRSASCGETDPVGPQGVCPDGWHVPSKIEYDELVDYCNNHYALGTEPCGIGKSLSAKVAWAATSNDFAVGNNLSTNNASGFSALPAGAYNGYHIDYGYYTDFWTASMPVRNNCGNYKMTIYYDNAFAGLGYTLSNTNYFAYSVRCLRN